MFLIDIVILDKKNLKKLLNPLRGELFLHI
jgi:hypothetical protein